jgi:hypothetical protein
MKIENWLWTYLFIYVQLVVWLGGITNISAVKNKSQDPISSEFTYSVPFNASKELACQEWRRV